MFKLSLGAIFGSVLVKLSALFIAMGACTAIAVAIGVWVFSSLTTSIQSLMEDVLPELQTNLQVVRQTAATSEALVQMAQSADSRTLDERTAVFLNETDELAGNISVLAADTVAELLPLLKSLQASGNEVSQSLTEQLRADAKLTSEIDRFTQVSQSLNEYMFEASDNAAFDLILGGEEAVETVDTTLSTFTEDFFPNMQTVLQTRAEFNLATGAIIAYLESSDTAYQSILRDLATSSTGRLSTLVSELAESDTAEEVLTPLQELSAALEAFVASDFRRRDGLRQEIFLLRQAGDAATSTMIDDLTFELIIIADDASTTNRDVIQGLIESKIQQVLQADKIERSVQTLMFVALSATSLSDVNAVAGAESKVTELAEQISTLAAEDGVDEDLRGLLDEILEFSNTSTGLLPVKMSALAAETRVDKATSAATEILYQISALSQAAGSKAVDAVFSTGNGVLDEARSANSRMWLTGLIAIALFVVLLPISWLLILRPLARITSVTQRLAKGDLSPVTGFERTGGEIGAMATALTIFRDGMIEREQLEEKEKERIQAEMEEERRRQEDVLRNEKLAAEKEQRERQEAMDREAREEAERQRIAEERRLEEERVAAEAREREEKIAVEKQERERAIQAERDARAAEMDLVVDGLASALDKLSSGDLTTQINVEFPEGFEELRTNFNAAVGNLSALIQNIMESSGRVNQSSSEIASAADWAGAPRRRKRERPRQHAGRCRQSGPRGKVVRRTCIDRAENDDRGVAKGERQQINGGGRH